jgi:phage shock protein PspC (stress-responsive transcriptional regulator)
MDPTLVLSGVLLGIIGYVVAALLIPEEPATNT